MVEIKLTNSRTRQKEVFTPIDAKNVRIYACGPTVYDRAHVGNARPAVIYDVLARLMRHVYGAEHVTYVRNVTDVDDKINTRARETGRAISDVTEETLNWYHEDMGALGVLPTDHEPRATDYISEMVEMIEQLVKCDHAYVADGHVLFRVRSYDGYGKFSGRSLDDMIAGARVEVAPYKEDPLDFVLWKPADGDVGWDSPWGKGRPGWHIECSAMSRKLLGDVFDIHAGGIDLKFPHHENEIAQSCCANHTDVMANYWLHNEMLQVEGKKMSKSLGNFFTVRDLLDQNISGETIRFVLLSTHYTKPMDWNEKKREESDKRLRRWHKLTDDIDAGEVPQEFVEVLADDINTAGAISVLHQLESEGRFAELKAAAQLLGLLAHTQQEEAISDEIVAQIQKLIEARLNAKAQKDFARADLVRQNLLDAGVELMDSKEGTRFELLANFDAEKLKTIE